MRTNTYANTHTNSIDCKGGAAAGHPPLLVYSIGMCIGICIGTHIGFCIGVYIVHVLVHILVYRGPMRPMGP